MQSAGVSGADALVSGVYGSAGRECGDEAGGESGNGAGEGRVAEEGAGEAEAGGTRKAAFGLSSKCIPMRGQALQLLKCKIEKKKAGTPGVGEPSVLRAWFQVVMFFQEHLR